jgi:hypothetical protein
VTAINIIRQSKSVHLIADGANYGPAGEVSPSAKLWPLPHLSAVVALRGRLLLGPLVAYALGGVAESYDGLKLVIVDALRGCVPQYLGMLGLPPEPEAFDLVVAGFSESGGPDSFIVCGDDRHPAVPPWTVTALPTVFMLPVDKELGREAKALFGSASSADDLDPEEHGLRMLELQRKRWFPLGAGQEGRARVGGFAQIMTVTEDLISTRIVHRWPKGRLRAPETKGEP